MNKIVLTDFILDDVQRLASVDKEATTTKNAAVAKLMKVWETKAAKRTANATGLTLMAVSLAACNDSEAAVDGESGSTDSVTTVAMVNGTDAIDTSASVVIGSIGTSSVLAADQLDLSTYEQGDSVAGDGDTQLEIVVNSFGATLTSYTSPDVTVSGVSSVVLVDENGADTLVLEMQNFESVVEAITLETDTAGSTFDVTVVNFVADDATFTLAMNPLTDTVGFVLVDDAELDGYTNLDAQVSAEGGNNGAGASSASITLGAAVDTVVLNAGTEGGAEIFLELTDDGFASSGPAEVGPLTLDITAVTAKQGEVEFDLQYTAVTATNTATVNALTINGFVGTLGRDSDGTHVSNDINSNGNRFNFDLLATVTATTTAGLASIGDVSVSDIVFTGARGATLEVIAFDRDAVISASGDAEIGDMTVGDISITMGETGAVSGVDFFANAAAVTGVASIGANTLGDVTISVGDNSVGAAVAMTNGAVATATGSGTVGALTIGDITIDAGDAASGPFGAAFSQGATANNTGDATIGAVTIGDMSLTVGDSATGTLGFGVNNAASAVATGTNQVVGDASIASISIGDISLDVGNTSVGAAVISMTGSVAMTGAAGTTASDIAVVGDASIGTVSIGDLSISKGTADGGTNVINVAFRASAAATGADDGVDGVVSLGDVTVGSLSGVVGTGATGAFDYDVGFAATNSNGNASIGDVDLGGLSFTGSDGAEINYLAQLDVNALSNNTGTGDATIGAVSFGSIAVVLGSSADAATVENQIAVNANAAATIGAVTVGAVAFTAGASATGAHTLNILNLDVTAVSSGSVSVGAVTVGDIALDVDAGSTVDANINYDVVYTGTSATLGNITVGDITATARSDGYADVGVDVNASGLSIGRVTLGDITVTGVAAAVTSTVLDFIVSVGGGSAEDVGIVTVGDINISLADFQIGRLTIGASATDDVGNMTIGDITVSVAEEGQFTLAVSVSAGDTAGTITIGDVSLTFDAEANPDAFNIFVTGDDADVTIGDITLSGSAFASSASNLDFTAVFVLTAGTADVTVGDIDYSGVAAYDATTATADVITIDVSAVLGATNIVAAETDTIIIDNAEQNNITLGDGDDVVTLNAFNSGVTISSVDAISNISIGDIINFNSANGGFVAIVETAAASFTAFTVAAASALTATADDVYIGKIGSIYYAAVDANGDDLWDVTNDFIVSLDINNITATALDTANGLVA